MMSHLITIKRIFLYFLEIQMEKFINSFFVFRFIYFT